VDPEFKLIKISNIQSDQLYVLLFDVSGSMSGMRINVLSAASKEFISTHAPIGMKLGLVQFHSYAQSLHQIVEVNEYTRRTLHDAVPVRDMGWTSIGAGLNKALDSIDNYGKYTQATIVLISDGEENTYPYISDVMSRILANNKLRIITYAIGNQASDRLEKLAKETNGYGLFFSLENVNDVGAESQRMAASLLDIVSSNCDLETQQVFVSSLKIL
jgi:uncharacterized protein YegL